jgi:AcrR family transcriptional regulator
MADSAAIEAEVRRFPHGRVPRAVRERQVLALAEDLFAERGYDRASMDELARRAGISKPVVYDLVGSKEELFERCFERAGEELAGSVAAAAAEHPGDLRDTLHAAGLAFLRFIEDHERAWRMLYAADLGGPAARHVQAIRREQARLTAGLLRSFPNDLGDEDLEVIAFAVIGAFEALASWRVDHPDVPAERLADRVVALTLPGLERMLGLTR